MVGTDTELTTEHERPEVTRLSEQQKGRILDILARRGSACGNCGTTGFEVGGALYLGFLFRKEELDAYMIAITCTNPQCSAPRTGLRLRESEFLDSA